MVASSNLTRRLLAPNYAKPFENSEFRGCMRRPQKWLPRREKLRHHCHGDDLARMVRRGQLDLRSEFEYVENRRLYTADCVWTTLNFYAARGNFYGPFQIELPLNVLDDRKFMIFERQDSMRRLYFVEMDDGCVYDQDRSGRDLRWIAATRYFETYRSGPELKSNTIYEFVLTTPVRLTDYRVSIDNHPYCLSRRCSGGDSKRDRARLIEIVLSRLERIAGRKAKRRFVKAHFPDIYYARGIREELGLPPLTR